MITCSLWHRGPSGHKYWNTDEEITKKSLLSASSTPWNVVSPICSKTKTNQNQTKTKQLPLSFCNIKQLIKMLISFYQLALEGIAKCPLWLELIFIKQNKIISWFVYKMEIKYILNSFLVFIEKNVSYLIWIINNKESNMESQKCSMRISGSVSEVL